MPRKHNDNGIIIQAHLFQLVKESLDEMQITREQLIALGMLVGTDFNPKGIKGIGPKNALKLVKKFGQNFHSLFAEVRWNDFIDMPWEEVYATIKDMPVTDEYSLDCQPIDKDQIVRLLVDEHNFSMERVIKTIDPYTTNKLTKSQKSLGDFFS